MVHDAGVWKLFGYRMADYWIGTQNLIEASAIQSGDTVLMLADRRSDSLTMETLEAALTAAGAHPMAMVLEPTSRYGDVPAPALEAMAASDVVIWMWPVFLTFSDNYRRRLKLVREDALPANTKRRKPYFVYFEGTPGLLATDYARFPNRLLWKIAEVVKNVVSAGSTIRLEGGHGTRLEAQYDGKRLYGMQLSAGDPPGRCHFPWGRCGVFNGSRTANGTVYLDCIQGIPGKLPEPVRWRIEDKEIVEVSGGGELKDHLEALFRKYEGSNRLNEIMFGYHPKAQIQRGIEDPMHWELISKMPWVGLANETEAQKFRHVDGAVLNTRVYIDDQLIVDERGHLMLLDNPEIVSMARNYGDPEEVLSPLSHEGHGSGTIW